MTTRRKAPTQERAKQTVTALVEATAQLLVERGYHQTTTNHIARRAGVSIGSLYQYFPDKQALVVELGMRFMDEQFALLQGSLRDVAHAPLEQAVRSVIEAMLRAKLDRPELSRVLFSELPSLGVLDLLQLWMQRAASALELIMSMRAAQLAPGDLGLAAHLIVSAMYGVTSYTVIYAPERLEQPSFVDETTRMILNYLKG